jgi:cephalosporin hydroxylase
MTMYSAQPHQGLLMDNLAALKLWHPQFYRRYRGLPAPAPITVQVNAEGVPMPVLDGNPYHAAVNPGTEPLVSLVDYPPGMGSPLRRTVIVGFGFGYHLMVQAAQGKAPAVIVSDLDCFAQALTHVDLRALLPVIELYFDDALPDLPRLTEILLHPMAASRNLPLMQQLHDRLEKHMPTPTGDLEYGVYFGSYRGVTCLKNPLDLMVDQMIISPVRPTLILEIGTLRGGSALYFNDLLRSMGGDRRIHTYDIDDHVSTQALEEEGIFVHGGGHDSFDPSIIRPNDRVLVIEDSSHSYRNTLAVLEKFGPHVSVGSYLIVEDTLSGLDGKRPYLEGGPMRALEEYLPAHPEFENDVWWQDFFGPNVTNCQRGFLRRNA